MDYQNSRMKRMTVDLKAMTRKELEKLKTSVERELTRTIERDRKAAIAAVQKAAREHGFDLHEVVGAKKPAKITKPKKKPKTVVTSPKYQHPENPDVTWTGKGRQPKWIKEAEAAGRSRDEFLIKA
jgi:DNA-binding protein H-NS